MKHGKILLVLALLLSLTACGQSNAATGSEAANSSNAAITEETAQSQAAGQEENDDTVAVESETVNTLGSQTADTVAIKAGETVSFGHYPQGTETPESIEWVVLDVQDGKALLLSRDCIESLPWHNTHIGVTWDNSDIRDWLNGEFLQAAFSQEEQERIILSDLDNGDDLNYGTLVGEDTQDKVFLLGGAELEKYLKADGSRTAKPTKHAVSHGAYTNGSGDCAWWLRSPGMTATSPAYIASAGSIGNRAHEVNETIIGVRPAMWIKTTGVGAADKPAINTSELWNKYDQDPEKYNATYNGALETATGVITFIGTDSHGTPSMEISDTVGGTSYVLGVFGSFDEMSEVSEGDTVTITGIAILRPSTTTSPGLRPQRHKKPRSNKPHRPFWTPGRCTRMPALQTYTTSLLCPLSCARLISRTIRQLWPSMESPPATRPTPANRPVSPNLCDCIRN